MLCLKQKLNSYWKSSPPIYKSNSLSLLSSVWLLTSPDSGWIWNVAKHRKRYAHVSNTSTFSRKKNTFYIQSMIPICHNLNPTTQMFRKLAKSRNNLIFLITTFYNIIHTNCQLKNGSTANHSFIHLIPEYNPIPKKKCFK